MMTHTFPDVRSQQGRLLQEAQSRKLLYCFFIGGGQQDVDHVQDVSLDVVIEEAEVGDQLVLEEMGLHAGGFKKVHVNFEV